MKRSLRLCLLTICAYGLIYPVPAYAETTRFKQWIAPLECTETQVIDGENILTILSPEACDDVLHPKPPDNGNGHPTPVTPGAPKTGFYRDPLVGFGFFLGWLIFSLLLIIYARRRSWDDLSKDDISDKIASRVSSFWTRKAK